MHHDLLKMKHKKSQVQMMETIAVLAVFFIVAILSYTLYTNIIKSSIEDEIEESANINAIKIAQKAYFFPEVQCSRKNVIANNCIDLLKLEAAADIMQKPENEAYYFDKFAFSKITVQEIYPDFKEFNPIYYRQMKDYTTKIVMNIPVSIFYPFEDRHSFGIMAVEVYSK